MPDDVKTNTANSTVPDWVQPDAFVDLLKSSVKGFSRIKNFKVSSGVGAGENYSTVMLRVSIDVELEDGTERPVSYMLKVPHEAELFKMLMRQHNMFDVERNMYNIYVPEMEQLYRDAGVDIKFGAQAYSVKGATTEYILLEDLSPRGFKNSNRLEGLDQVHTEAALQRLAMWHAASAVRAAIKGAYPDQVLMGFYKEENKIMMCEMNKQMTSNFLNCCVTYDGHEEYLEQVRALQPRATEEIFKRSKPDPNEFNALNHGDFWSNNIMYSHDSFGKIKETYLIDFQLPKFGTVAQDLYYFLLSSTKFEDKLTKFDYYVKFYHENLLENLKLLKYPKTLPTLCDLHISLFKHGLWGFYTAISVMSGILLDPTESARAEHFASDSVEAQDFKNLLYSNARYRKHIQVVMPWLFNRGALEL
ncbi:PREDICTED: uncharacterized protein LOC108608826 [Drosophila arizonae]|uniref:Uncharacterized protein LOC108608826 n=1 Tax=Drosophila arizonae TaxID=7263 RepID=A0ABM1NLR5_DROAR|nr:PREDICTED: uncharacterized protein LOC108608826 [Drosophila arizonae]